MNTETERTKKLRKRGKILPFERSGEFLYKCGLNKLDCNNLADALAYYRLALERDPGNRDVRISMAEVLSEMSRFEESNRILLLLLGDGWFKDKAETEYPDMPSECFYGMGCNFLSMNDYVHARDSLEHYLDVDPEGEFVYDAYDILDAIDDDEQYENGEVLSEVSREDDALDLVDEGRFQLEHEQYKAAMASFRHASELDPKLSAAHDGISLAHFCLHDTKDAISEAEKALEMTPDDIQARCNLSMFLHSSGDNERANRMADPVAGMDTDSPEDASRALLVLMELSRFREAKKFAEKLLTYTPYDEGALHRLAICAYETGDYSRAIACYDKLLKIDRGDTIARYYRGICRAASAGSPKRIRFMMNYQVPYDEMVARINHLNEFVSMPREKLEVIWKAGGELAELVNWGFTLPDNSVKRAMLMLVGSFGDARGEYILRDFALRQDQSDDLKQEAFTLLAQQGARSPYLGYIGGELIESRVSVTGSVLGHMPKSYRQVVELCFSSMHGVQSEECLLESFKLWGEYVASLSGEFPKLTHQQVNALAAALEYSACRATGAKVTRTEVCAKYGVSPLRFRNAITKLGKAAKK